MGPAPPADSSTHAVGGCLASSPRRSDAAGRAVIVDGVRSWNGAPVQHRLRYRRHCREIRLVIQVTPTGFASKAHPVALDQPQIDPARWGFYANGRSLSGYAGRREERSSRWQGERRPTRGLRRRARSLSPRTRRRTGQGSRATRSAGVTEPSSQSRLGPCSLGCSWRWESPLSRNTSTGASTPGGSDSGTTRSW